MNDDVINKKSTIDTLITESLDELSITELRDRVSFLEDEINRCKEKIDNKSQKTQEGFFRIGMFLLVSLMFFTTFNDLKDLGLFN